MTAYLKTSWLKTDRHVCDQRDDSQPRKAGPIASNKGLRTSMPMILCYDHSLRFGHLPKKTPKWRYPLLQDALNSPADYAAAHAFLGQYFLRRYARAGCARKIVLAAAVATCTCGDCLRVAMTRRARSHGSCHRVDSTWDPLGTLARSNHTRLATPMFRTHFSATCLTWMARRNLHWNGLSWLFAKPLRFL